MLYSVVQCVGFHEVATASDVRHKGLLILVVMVGMIVRYTIPVAGRFPGCSDTPLIHVPRETELPRRLL